MRFLRENWIYIVVPIVVIAAVILALVLFGGGEAAPGQYEL